MQLCNRVLLPVPVSLSAVEIGEKSMKARIGDVHFKLRAVYELDDQSGQGDGIRRRLVDQTAELLALEWPSQGVEFRVKQLEEQVAPKGTRNSSFSCSFLLTDADLREVYGHVMVKNAPSRSDGNTAILFSLVVRDDMRGLGIGRELIGLLEKKIVNPPFNVTYLYLYTHTAEEFYRKLGYVSTEGIASSAKLNYDQALALERVLQRRVPNNSNRDRDSDPSKKGQVEVEDISVEDVWLRKVVWRTRPASCIKNPFYIELNTVPSPLQSSSNCHFISLPWLQQIGPSCGLCLLEMLQSAAVSPERGLTITSICMDTMKNQPQITHQFYSFVPDVISWIEQNSPVNNLLDVAREHGFTFNGEILDSQYLLMLAKHILPFRAELLSLTYDLTSPQNIVEILDTCGVLLIAYDRDGNNQPVDTVMSFREKKQRPHWLMVIGYFHSQSKLYVIGQHGMSDKFVVCSWEALAKSNMSLTIEGVTSTYRGEEICLDKSGQEIPLKDRVISIKFKS